MNLASRSFDRFAKLLCILLAFFAITFEVQYKLSLYEPPSSPAHRIQHAKYLSKDKQSEEAKISKVVRRESSPAAFSFLLGGVLCILLLSRVRFNLLPLSQAESDEAVQWHLCGGQFDSYFVRPPPILL